MRWTAIIIYREEDPYGVKDKLRTTTYAFEELRELHDFIEYGPSWDTLVSLQVVLNRRVPNEQLNRAEQATLQREAAEAARLKLGGADEIPL